MFIVMVFKLPSSNGHWKYVCDQLIPPFYICNINTHGTLNRMGTPGSFNVDYFNLVLPSSLMNNVRV